MAAEEVLVNAVHLKNKDTPSKPKALLLGEESHDNYGRIPELLVVPESRGPATQGTQPFERTVGSNKNQPLLLQLCGERRPGAERALMEEVGGSGALPPPLPPSL